MPSFDHDIFVIHAEADEPFVRGYLLPQLSLTRKRALLLGELELGQVIVEAIQRQVQTSRVTIVVLSPAYLRDRWALFGEQLAAYARVASDDGRLLVPLLRADCEVPSDIRMLVGLDFRESQKETWTTQVARLRELLDRPSLAQLTSPAPPSYAMQATESWDVFIVHASEDKETVAHPLARMLRDRGLRVWIDIDELRLGDSLRTKIEVGLSRSQWGVAILSPSFFQKPWPQAELDALVSRELVGERVLLPVWHNLGAADVANHSPLLATRLGVSTSDGLENVRNAIVSAMDRGRRAGSVTTTDANAFQDAWFRSFRGIGRQSMNDTTVFEHRQLGPFLVQRQIGHGGSGIVFSALHVHLGKTVALKVLYPLDDRRSTVTRVSERGLRALAALRHPNVLSPLDFGYLRADNRISLFIVTELIQGLDLEAWSHNISKHSDALNKRIKIAIQLSQGIKAAHACRFIGDLGFEEAGILHGDIKPDNVIIETDSEKALLLDFMIPDIQRLLHFHEETWWHKRLDGNFWFEPPITSVFGTPMYMAPEQEVDGTIFETSDIYSLGMTFSRLFWPTKKWSWRGWHDRAW